MMPLRWVGAGLSTGALAMLIALAYDAAAVGQLLPAFKSIGHNTLVAFGLCGIGLLAGDRPRLMVFSGSLLVLMALAVLAQFQLAAFPADGFWRHLLNTAGDTPWPGRMSPPTAVAFLLAGAVFLLLPRARNSVGVLAIHGLIGAVSLLALIGLMGHVMGIAIASSEYPVRALMSLPTALGLFLLSVSLYVLSSRSEGFRVYFGRYPDRRILSISVFVLLVLLLIGGLTSSAIVVRHALNVFQRTLVDSLRANSMLFEQSVGNAEHLARLAISLASRGLEGKGLRIYLERPDAESVSAVWREGAEGTAGACSVLYGKPVTQPAFAISLSAGGDSRLIWQDGWLVQVRHAGIGAQVRIPALEQLFHYHASLGATADISISALHGDGIQYIYTRLFPEPFFLSSRLGRDGKPMPAALALQGRSGSIIARDYRDKEVVAAYVPIFDGRLGMVQKVDADELFAALREYFWEAVLFLLFLSTSGAFLLYRHVLPLARRLRETQTSLEDSLRKNELILQNAGEGIYGIDARGRATFVNAAAERLLGYTLADLREADIHEVIHHHRRDGSPYPAGECPMRDSLHAGNTRHERDEVFWRKDGQALDVEYTSAPIREAGRVTGAVVVFSDVAERRRNEAALARWQHIFEHAEWGVAIGGADGRCLELVNPSFARMHGYSVEELTGKPIVDVFPPACHADLSENIRLAHEKGHHTWESWQIRKDGSRFPVLLDVTAVRDEAGQARYRVVNMQDITARRQAEDTLRESEAHLARAQAQANLGSWWLDVANDTLEWSAENYRIFGVPLGARLNYQSFLDRIHPDDRAYVDRAWCASMGGESYDIQHRILVDGQVKWVRERAELEFAPDGTLLRGIGTSQDITELKRHEDELLRSRQSLRELAAHHEKIREEERRRIAREIHDELGQYLTALRMDAAMLGIRHGAGNPELENHIAGMKETIDTTIGVVRDIAAALRPGALDMGLVSAAEWLLAGFEERTGVRCHLNAPREDLELDNERATAAFRILQESLTNVARYAQAGTVDVDISVDADALVMSVRDDGVGFDPAEVRDRKTFGLMGIRERALMFGGESRIDSEPGAGTTLRVRIPLPTESAQP